MNIIFNTVIPFCFIIVIIRIKISGYARLIEDCGTLRRFETPPEQIHRFLGSNIQVVFKTNEFPVKLFLQYF